MLNQTRIEKTVKNMVEIGFYDVSYQNKGSFFVIYYNGLSKRFFTEQQLELFEFSLNI